MSFWKTMGVVLNETAKVAVAVEAERIRQAEITRLRAQTTSSTYTVLENGLGERVVIAHGQQFVSTGDVIIDMKLRQIEQVRQSTTHRFAHEELDKAESNIAKYLTANRYEQPGIMRVIDRNISDARHWAR